MFLLINIQRKKRHLLSRTALALCALSKKEYGKKHRKSEAHEDGYGKNFHVTVIKAQRPLGCFAALALGYSNLV